MPTYTQLRAEPWWGREIVPDPLRDLGRRLCAAYGRPPEAWGTKGDNLHVYGAHRSQEWILNSRYCTNRTYTVQSGLTALQARYIAAGDFNPGSTERMIEICGRLDQEVRAGRLEVVREWYGNLNGDERVDGYDNVRNRAATSDASHLWHLHMTFDRRLVADPAAMARVGDVLLSVGGKAMFPQRGDKGEHVRYWQRRLIKLGYKLPKFGADGDCGDETIAAINAARRDLGYDDTNVDRLTGWHAEDLDDLLAKKRARELAGSGGLSDKDLTAAIRAYVEAHKEELRGPKGEPGRTPKTITFATTGEVVGWE